MFSLFSKPKDTNPWLYAGPITSFPNLDPPSGSTDLSNPVPSSNNDNSPADTTSQLPSCKIFSTISPTTLTELTPSSLSKNPSPESPTPSPSQTLLIFKYRAKIHAIEHACPHQGHPMSEATVSDIEDFGVVLSAGVTCPKHGWTFDLFTGEADTGRYRLGIWDVEARSDNGGEGVWVRKKGGGKLG